VIKNIGVSDTLRGVRCLLTIDDSLITINDDICGIGDLLPGEALQSPDGFKISFSSDMPSQYISHFGITIEDTMGNIFTDEFILKEGDLLSVLSFGDYYTDQMYKEEINSWIQNGYQLIVPSRLLEYKKWNNIGFIARDPNKGSAAMMLYSNLNGGATVTDPSLWREDDKKIFIEGCYIVSLIPEILAPDENSVYYKGDPIDVTVQYDVIYECGDGSRQSKRIVKDYTYLGSDRHEPDKHYLCVEGFTEGGERVLDTRPIWVIEFKIDEDNVTKYFNPYKPDSARIKYKLEPPNYANPDSFPNPLSMQVEIRDKDSVLVYGPRDLTVDEQRHQLLWWDGTNNDEDTLDMEGNPYNVNITGKYKESATTTSSTLKATASSSEEGEFNGDIEENISYVNLDIFWARNNLPVFVEEKQVVDSLEFKDGAIVDENDDHDYSKEKEPPDNENEKIEGNFPDYTKDILDMVRLKVSLDCEIPETFIDEKLELNIENISNKDKMGPLVRVFNEEGKVVVFPEKIDLKELEEKDSINYYVEGIEPGDWTRAGKNLVPGKDLDTSLVKFKLVLLDSEGNKVEGSADSVKLQITDELIYYRHMVGYDCFPNDTDSFPHDRASFRKAFEEAEVVVDFRKGDTIKPARLYPKKRAVLMANLQLRYNRRTPWYLEAGNEPENGWDWPPGGITPGSPKADSVLAINLAHGPNNVSLIFVGRIRDVFKFTNWDSLLTHAVPHEFGHHFGELTDKYLTPKDHSPGTDCLMDNFTLTTDAQGNNVATDIFNSFCAECKKKLKNGKNKWDKGDK